MSLQGGPKESKRRRGKRACWGQQESPRAASPADKQNLAVPKIPKPVKQKAAPLATEISTHLYPCPIVPSCCLGADLFSPCPSRGHGAVLGSAKAATRHRNFGRLLEITRSSHSCHSVVTRVHAASLPAHQPDACPELRVISAFTLSTVFPTPLPTRD